MVARIKYGSNDAMGAPVVGHREDFSINHGSKCGVLCHMVKLCVSIIQIRCPQESRFGRF